VVMVVNCGCGRGCTYDSKLDNMQLMCSLSQL